jgi:hypothetical protein
VEMGHTIPTGFPPDTLREIEAVFEAGIRAIGIDNGAAKGDIKLTSNGPMVGEIAARLSGGYMSGWTFPLCSGVEVTEAALHIAVGFAPGDLTPRVHKVCAERALISIPGFAGEVNGAADAGAVEGVTNVFLRVAAGDHVVFPANNVQKCGNVLAVAESREAAGAAASRALARLQIRLRPLEPDTDEWISRTTAHHAFGGLPEELRRRIASLPVFRGKAAGLDPVAAIRVSVLPGWEECTALDWHGASFADSTRLACERGNARIVGDGGPEGFKLGRVFWQALARGGHQAAVYVLDSVREAARRGTLATYLEGQ